MDKGARGPQKKRKGAPAEDEHQDVAAQDEAPNAKARGGRGRKKNG
jgi:hypothetical protein